jgi:tetratricopeptide (TPR) repeat protein
LTAAVVLLSCTAQQGVRYNYPQDLLYNEQVDSLGWNEFMDLPGSQRRMRQRMAATWRERAEDARTVPSEVRSLHNAVGLAPDAPRDWLRLAELTRWCGHHQDAMAYLQGARATVRYAILEERDDLLLRIAILSSWLHYDRGEWASGLAWSDSAIAMRPTDRHAILIRGLLLAGAERSLDATYLAKEIERIDFFHSEWRWIRGVNDYYRGYLKEAFAQMRFSPNPLHRAECWFDRAMIEERMGYWSDARRHYERALSSLPFRDHSFLFKHEQPPPEQQGGEQNLPVWLAYDRFFVTGSPVVYTALALDRFEAATGTAEGAFWADAGLNAASICIRKRVGQPWTRAWRGRIYAQLDMNRLAELDLARAVVEFQRIRRTDAPTLAWLGHIKLEKEAYLAAIPLLQKAVASDATQAKYWTDLGYALIMTNALEEAMLALDRALALDASLAVAWYNRGLMYFNAQQWENAVADLQEAARLAPDNPEIQEVLQRAILMVQRSRIER